MSEQGKRVQHSRQDDAAFNKMLLWLAGCVALEGLTLLLRQVYLNYSLTEFGLALVNGLSAFFGVFCFAGAALSVGCAVWLILFLRQGKRGRALAAPLACTGAALWLWIASILCNNYDFAAKMGMGLLCVLPAVIAALAAIFFLYQREFFCNAVISGVGITALWVYKQIYMEHPRMTYCGFAAVWVFLALCAAAAYYLSRHQGAVGSFRVLPVKTTYLLIYLTCAFTAAALLAALIIGIGAAYYVMFAEIGWLFCLAVYYTVKLM